MDFKQIADEALTEGFFQSMHDGSHAGNMSHSYAETFLLREAQYSIAFCQCDSEGLFKIKVRSSLQRRDCHVMMLRRPARRDRDEVWFFPREHLAVFRVAFPSSTGDHRFSPPCLYRISHGDDGHIWHTLEDLLDAMTIVPCPGVANDSSFSHRCRCRSKKVCGEEG